MYEQNYNLWKERKKLKQCGSIFFKCNGFMLSILFLTLFTFLIITFETYSNTDSKTKALFTLYEKF